MKSAKFHLTNVHTMDELRLTGNCMKGSRPVLSFDESFQRLGHLKLLKELFVDIFGVPRGHPKSKPFVDRVMAFYYADNKVSIKWLRMSSVWSPWLQQMMSVCQTFGSEKNIITRLRWNETLVWRNDPPWLQSERYWLVCFILVRRSG